MITVRKLPGELLEAVPLWQAAGGSEQPPSHWSPVAWQHRFPEHSDYLSTLPRPISRADVTARCNDAHAGPDQATRAFLAAMIWGYGPVGYGGFRTRRVLDENQGAGEKLAAVAKIAREEGGPAAFTWLAQRQHRLRWLGVAFATKFLFFCAAGGNGQPALVLDRLVREWMSNNLAWQLNLEWDVDDYCEYVDTMCAWAVELDIEPGNLEMLVFQLAANADPQSLWSAPELFASIPSETLATAFDGISDEDSVLRTLDDAAALFAALPGNPDPDDNADFERGVRYLKRIVVARPTSR